MPDRRHHSDTLIILVLGYIVRGPLGGLAWHHLQYVLGLKSMGHDVWFLEDSGDYPSCYNPLTWQTGVDPGYGLQFTASVFQRLGMESRWAYYDAHTQTWHGPAASHTSDLCRNADVLLNLSGVNPLRPWLLQVPHRVLVDTDPVFTQIKHLTEPAAMEQALAHSDYFSFGENIGKPDCSVPNDGLPWKPTRQPVVLDAWPVVPAPVRGAFTTVMQWDSYSTREYAGRSYGMKSESFSPYIDLPGRTGLALEIALGSTGAPRDALTEQGWHLRDPLEVTRDPWSYQDYIHRSRGEFSIAKHGYVVTNSGWFSERSAVYLASGRPVVVQDTGFSDWLTTDAGIVPFDTPEEALAALEDVNARYPEHCCAARTTAAEYFDANKILAELIDDILSFSRNIKCNGGPTT